MDIAAIATPAPNWQPSLLPDLPQRRDVDIDIVQVELDGGVVQLSWADLDLATVTTSRKRGPVKPTKKASLHLTEVEVAGGGVQLAFI